MIDAIRRQNPLIHNITNDVVMNSSANALLAIGASPIMAHAQEELSDLLSLANALVINIGTLDQAWIENAAAAIHIAGEKNIPIVLDPVGAGASAFRTKTALQFLATQKISVLRGNASEIISIEKNTALSKGVDSQHDSKNAVLSAKTLSQQFHCAVVVSGKTDYCVFENEVVEIVGGDELMQVITGMGCIATTVIAAFLSVNQNKLEACANAMTCMKRCAEKASALAQGPGTFFTLFLDALFLYEK